MTAFTKVKLEEISLHFLLVVVTHGQLTGTVHHMMEINNKQPDYLLFSQRLNPPANICKRVSVPSNLFIGKTLILSKICSK